MDLGLWLRGLGMAQYEQVFRDNHIDAELLPDLTNADLRDIGIVSLGHRKKLLGAIAALDVSTMSDKTLEVFAGLTAERRQITVLFCDLVGSTQLSTQLDPEELRQVLTIYQEAVTTTIRAARGYVAHLIGDGVMAYFGWPTPDETHAETAVRTALAILEARTLQGRPVRIGIATGLVVVGELIGSEPQEAAVGSTPNLAARLQALGEPDEIVVCDNTAAQLGGLFRLADLGRTELKGFDLPQRAWRVLEATALVSHSEALPVGELTALIGRNDELQLLHRRWEQAKSGELQIALVSGEAGIGKSRLLAALQERLRDEPHVSLRYYCAAHRQDSALHPIISRWEQQAGFSRSDSTEVKLVKLEAVVAGEDLSVEDVALLAAMLSISTAGHYPSLELSPQRLKERTFALLTRRVVELARRQPILMLLEDTHWADPSTLELFEQGMDQLSDNPVLLVVTYRPEFVAPWVGRPHVTVLALSRLDRRRSAELVGQVAADRLLPRELMERIVMQTDGVPLFIEELTKAVLESTSSSDESLPLTVPATLQASLMARLDRLSAGKQVAQTGAVVGREFSHRLLAAIAGMPEPSLAKGLQELLASGLAFRRGVLPDITYVFKHALVRDVAYESLVRERRTEIHRRVISAVESDASLENMETALLGYHCAQAGLIEKAANYYRIAGEQSAARAALVETRVQLERGLRFAENLPEGTDRRRLKAELLLALGSLHLTVYGLASEEARNVLDRAADLGRELGDVRIIIRALWARGAVATNRVELHTHTSIGDELSSVARRDNDVRAIIVALAITGSTASMLGEFQLARERLEKALALSADSRLQSVVVRPSTPEVMAGGYLGISLAPLGSLNRAKEEAQFAVDRAQRQSRLSLAFALNLTMRTRLILGDDEHLRRDAEKLYSISDELGLPYWLSLSRCVLGWLLAKRGDKEAALDTVRSSLQSLHGLGVELHREWADSALVSDVLGAMGRYTEAIVALDAGLAFSARTKVAWFDAELHRRKAELLLNIPNANTPDAENELRKAIDIARSQSAKLFELRAATSLARLWSEQGRQSEAHDLLRPIHDWFSEGLDSVDLQESKEVLNAVS